MNIPSGGSYYLGANGNYYGISFVSEFITKLMKDKGITKVISCGTSKAGTAALLFGILLGFDAVVAGACQYYIGDYLNNDAHMESLIGITGHNPVLDSDINKLNNVVQDIIKDSVYMPQIYLHYSEKEHTYPEHIVFLIDDLRKAGFLIQTDIENYENHWDVGKYFPGFLKKILSANS